MAEKTLNTRIQQKHDIEANWLKATNFIPKAGEIIVYDADAAHPFPRIKIGDDETVVSELPFITSQPDWEAQENEEGYIKNKPKVETEDDALEMLFELGIIDPATDEENNIFTNENGDILAI